MNLAELGIMGVELMSCIIGPGHIWHCRRTARNRVLSNNQKPAGSSRCRRWAAFTTGTSAGLPEQEHRSRAGLRDFFGSFTIIVRHLYSRRAVTPAATRKINVFDDSDLPGRGAAQTKDVLIHLRAVDPVRRHADEISENDRYLGCTQKLRDAGNDRMCIEPEGDR